MPNLKQQFLTPSSNWNSHLPMLWLGLQLTQGRVTELGSGMGSTSLLRQYCQHSGRPFFTYDSNEEWARKTMSTYCPNWHNNHDWEAACGLAFVDHAPGEHRVRAISQLHNVADVMVIHDTEEVGAAGYGYARIWPLFKYRLNYNRLGPGAGCSMVSNKVDLHAHAGLYEGLFNFEVKTF